MTTILLDGDLYVFQATAAAESPVHFGEDLSVLTASISKSRAAFDARVDHFMTVCKADRVVVCLSSPDRHYFRHDVLSTYKQNRSGGRKPITFAPVIEAICKDYETYTRPGLEGDDVMGILSTNPRIIPGKRIIVSGDKDMRTIPGLLYRDGEVIEIDEETANYAHMYQTLVGDNTDGYSGCPSVGPVGAKKILGTLRTYAAIWPEVVKAFNKAGFGEEWAITQARVARILRTEDYDFNLKKPILWRPPTNDTRDTRTGTDTPESPGTNAVGQHPTADAPSPSGTA